MKKILRYSLLASSIWFNVSNLYAATQSVYIEQDDKLKAIDQVEIKTPNFTKMSKVEFICPMHPHVVGKEGDTCPICGMDLEPTEISVNTRGNYLVEVDGNMQQALGIRTTKAKRSTLWHYASTIGTINYDESNILQLHSRLTGWIEKLHVGSVGDKIKKGQLLYTLYSPELIKAQEDYLLIYRTAQKDPKNSSYKDLSAKAKLRLELLGMSSQDINKIRNSGKSLYRVPFYAPSSGVIKKLNVREGMYIQPQDEIITLADLDSVWIIAEVFEEAQIWLKLGQSAEINIPEQGIYRLAGKVNYIYPELDPQTRTLKVRIKLKNPSHKLKINSFVEVGIFGGSKPKALAVPIEALIQTEKENRLVVQNHDASFSVKTVKTGIESQGKVEILEGLLEGDRVVLSGQFLLDSEASLKGSLQRINSDKTSTSPHTEH